MGDFIAGAACSAGGGELQSLDDVMSKAQEAGLDPDKVKELAFQLHRRSGEHRLGRRPYL